MPLLVNSVPNLAQGVSQQPDNLRFPGQCDEQINAWATVVEGLVKRPPTEYTKKLLDTKLSTQDPVTEENNLFSHFVKRSEQNQYCVTVSLGGVGVINVADGTQVLVAVTSIANSYLSLGSSVTNPLADLRALTVADYTFLVNKNRVIEKATNAEQKSDAPPDEALIVVKLGDYEKSYNVYIDDQIVNFDSSIPYIHGLAHTNDHIPDGGTTSGTYKSGTASTGGIHADTTRIAKDLKHLIEAHLSNTTGISSVNIGSGGTGWLSGDSTGTTTESFVVPLVPGITRNETLTIEKKLVLEISQPTASPTVTSTALIDLHVTKGVIDGVSISRRGSGFNPDDATYPLVLTFKTLGRAALGDGDLEDVPWSPVSNTGSGQSLTASLSTRTGFEVTHTGSLIKITSDDGPFKIRVEDGLADQGMGVVYREVNSITDLPTKCYDKFKVKVIGDADIDQDDYYVRFSTKEKEEYGEGTWVETVGYYQDESPGSVMEGIDTMLVKETMPVTLVPFFNGNDIKDFRLQTPNELLIVKQGSTYYRLDKEHSATNDNKPGVGTNWREFWTEYTDITQGYLEWKLGVYYYGPTETTSGSGWGGRAAGDDFTNPFPSFVGKQIRDIFFFKNRLGILTDSNIIFSEADEYFNFFRTTTQQLLDSAVIDVGLSHTKVAILEHAVPFQEKLMLFSQGSQFVLRGADVLSPKTVAISPVTEYDLSDGIQPVALGNYIYFPFKRNDFEGVYEYFVDNNTETFNAEEITQQVPKYITSDVQKIVGSQAENTIVMSTTEDAKTLFVYKYFWSNKEKIQSAWMKFTFNRDIRGFDFIDSNLHLITADTDGLHLEKLTLEDGITDDGLDYTLYLDSKVDGNTLTTSYDAASKTTTISDFKYDPTDVVVYTKAGNKVTFTRTSSTAGTVSGAVANYVTHSGTIYKCETTHTSPSSFVAVDTSVTPNVTYWSVSTDVSTAPDWVAGKFYNNDKYFVAGIPYNMLYRFSDQSLKQPTERGGRSASDYTYQTIRNGSINYADTGHFTVEVTPKYRDKYSYAFNPDSLGANLTLNAFTPQDGHFRFPVQCQPNDAKIEVVTDSALPVKLLAAEFESMVISRSRRYGA